MKKIITISRQFGAAGSTIGKAVADRLGFEFYYRELILQMARNSNLDVEILLKWDEKVPANFGFAQSLFDFSNKPLGEKLYSVQESVIRRVGEKGKCVIVGRNANDILKEFDHTLHVFVYGTEEWRLEHMKMKMPEVSDARLLEEMHNIDKARKKYCSYFTGNEFGVAEHYDICLSASSLGIEKCIDMICMLAD